MNVTSEESPYRLTRYLSPEEVDAALGDSPDMLLRYAWVQFVTVAGGDAIDANYCATLSDVAAAVSGPPSSYAEAVASVERTVEWCREAADLFDSLVEDDEGGGH